MRAAIVLAAGGSRRFGPANKLLARRGGRPLIRNAVEAALAAPVARVIVVTGAQASRVAATARGPRVTIVRARDHARGVGASLRAGLAALWPIERDLLVFLGDMPAVPRHVACRLTRSLRPGVQAVRPTYRGRPGHPVLLRRPSAERIAALRQDRGLAAMLGKAILAIPARRGATLDIDHPRSLRSVAG